MQPLENIDLASDPAAARYVKDEIVQVEFAHAAGALQSLEGANAYASGDALVTGSLGNRWVVSRARFEQRYRALVPLAMGQDGAYRNLAVPVLARQMSHPFAIRRSTGGDVLHGAAGDWLMQYAPGDYGITEQRRFAAVYRRAN
ncbi:MAG: PGDYG domain-containing protein [Steroidobacteraceae bacterium]